MPGCAREPCPQTRSQSPAAQDTQRHPRPGRSAPGRSHVRPRSPAASDRSGRANLRPPGDLRDHRSRRQALGDNRPLLLSAPPTPPFRARDDFKPRHRTVSSTSANAVACTSAYQPDTPPQCKAAITGRLPITDMPLLVSVTVGSDRATAPGSNRTTGPHTIWQPSPGHYQSTPADPPHWTGQSR